MSRWIDLDSKEVQELICTDTHGNDYLYIDELNEIAHIFPVRADKEGVLCL